MKRCFLFFVMLITLLTACQPAASQPQPAETLQIEPTKTAMLQTEPAQEGYLQTYQYLPLTEDVVNPERGFRYSFDQFVSSDYGVYRNLGVSLVYAEGDLRPYREQDLPQSFLDTMKAAFDAVRAGGVKVVLRFKYNDGPWPDSEPDASQEQILRHIQQLAPLLQQNADVIAWIDAGFIGAWGEWHSSTHGLDTDINAKREIVNALAAALPPDRFILLRYPPDLMAFYPTPLTAEQAFTGTLQSRLGYHNDCFLSSETDVGTYDGDRTAFINYLGQTTQFTPADGETCAEYPPLQACEAAIHEMEALHWSGLNLSYHKGVIRYWQKQGCFEEIKRRLGYRLVLQDATLPSLAHIGESLDMHVRLTNEGFASPLNPRPLFVVLTGPATVTLPVSDVDPRRWLPGGHDLNFSVALPDSLPEGEYRLALWLPDGYESLRSDPRYSIRFANQNVWDETNGWNVLGTIQLTNRPVSIVTVTPAPPTETPTPLPTPSSLPDTRRPAENGLQMSALLLSTPPVIDGDLSDWSSFPCATLDQSEQIGYGDPAAWGGPQDLSGSFCWGWDEQALYLAFKAQDESLRAFPTANLWENDYVEIWLDTNLAKDYDVAKNDADDFQFGFMPGNFADVLPGVEIFVPSLSAEQKALVEAKFAQTADGYQGEAKIPFALFGEVDLSQGAFGAVLSLSDNDSDHPAQEMMISTAPASIAAWGNPTSWTNLILTKP